MHGHATAAMTLDLSGRLLDDDLFGVAEALGKAIDVLRNHCGTQRRARSGAYIRSQLIQGRQRSWL